MPRQRWQRQRILSQISRWLGDIDNRSFVYDEPRKKIGDFLDGRSVQAHVIPQRLRTLARWYAGEAVIEAEAGRAVESKRSIYEAHLCDWTGLALLAHLADAYGETERKVLSANDSAFALARAVAIGRLDDARQIFGVITPRLGSHFHDVQVTRLLPLVLGVCADWLGQSADPLAGLGVAEEPAYRQVRSLWRSPDTEALVAALVGACAVHLERSGEHTAKDTFEFWEQTTQIYPAELLMVLALRTQMGLSAPVVPHPLLAGPQAVVVDTNDVVADDLLTRLRRRASEIAPELADGA